MSPAAKRADEWATEWVAENLGEHESVVSASPAGASVVAVKRKSMPDVMVGCVSVPRLDAATVIEVAESEPSIRIIVNVKTDAIYEGPALDEAEARGIAIGGMGDLRRALRDEANPADYVHSDTRFIERGLTQHSGVVRVERVNRGCYRLTTRQGDEVTVAVGHDYEVTADAVRTAIANHGPVDAVVTANPNAREISPEAVDAGSSAGVEVLQWSEFYGRLNQPWS